MDLTILITFQTCLNIILAYLRYFTEKTRNKHSGAGYLYSEDLFSFLWGVQILSVLKIPVFHLQNQTIKICPLKSKNPLKNQGICGRYLFCRPFTSKEGYQKGILARLMHSNHDAVVDIIKTKFCISPRRKPCISSIPEELHITNAKCCISLSRRRMHADA